MSGQPPKPASAATRYEEVARVLLDRFHADFGLARVEGKQSLEGRQSGTEWEIDARAVCDGDAGFLIVECRRYTKSRLDQEAIAAIAYRIFDTGAAGAITVSPLDLQFGAKKVAGATNIIHVRLTPSSTPEEFQLQFLDKLFLGFHDSVSFSESGCLTITHEDGTTEIFNL